ncbi:unnamed protein product, partial [Brenthis ino]
MVTGEVRSSEFGRLRRRRRRARRPRRDQSAWPRGSTHAALDSRSSLSPHPRLTPGSRPHNNIYGNYGSIRSLASTRPIGVGARKILSKKTYTSLNRLLFTNDHPIMAVNYSDDIS